MLPEVLAQVKRLLDAGATVVCSKPNQSPSLANYPKCDEEVRSLANQLWGEGKESVQPVGNGKLFTHGDVAAALTELGIAPIAKVVTPKSGDIRIAARQDGDTKLFFVANVSQKPAKFAASFRVNGMQPELWDAETGVMQFAPLWREKDGRTEVDLSLGAAKSVFVVFRNPAASVDRLASIDADGGYKLSSDEKGRPVIAASTNLSGAA